MAKRKTEPETYQCPDCGNTTEIQRLSGRTRSVGHLKWMWCVRCKASTNHALVRPPQLRLGRVLLVRFAPRRVPGFVSLQVAALDAAGRRATLRLLPFFLTHGTVPLCGGGDG